MTLKSSIEIRVRGKKVTIPANADIKMIADHDDVLIVEYNGERFSVRRENVNE